jgi:hypothetical protein
MDPYDLGLSVFSQLVGRLCSWSSPLMLSYIYWDILAV